VVIRDLPVLDAVHRALRRHSIMRASAWTHS
jgi:hypothetical protein